MPSEGQATRLNLSQQVSQLRKIPFSALHMSKDLIGKGVFGKCFSGFMSSHIEVCVKAFRLDDRLIHTFPVEAVLTSTLCHPNLPWFYGLSEHGPSRMIVLSFHGINGKSYTIHQALQTNCQDLLIEINWRVILVGLASALKYIHSKDILHNDIKSDNIIIDNRSLVPQSILIDFGKVVFFQKENSTSFHWRNAGVTLSSIRKLPLTSVMVTVNRLRAVTSILWAGLFRKLMISFFTYHSLHLMPHYVFSIDVNKGHLLMNFTLPCKEF